MKQIKLTDGFVAVVDDDDFEKLCSYNWRIKNSGGNKIYAIRSNVWKQKPAVLYMHKEIFDFPVLEVDHINGDTLDNRKQNLRVCTHQQNIFNQKLNSKNTSGYKGVSFNKGRKKYEAYIKKNQKHMLLGFYDDILDAAKAYNKAATELFGEFARLNVIEETINEQKVQEEPSS